EVGTDDVLGGPAPDERPAEIERVMDSDEGAAVLRLEAPLYFHAGGDAAHVAEADERDLGVERLLGAPADRDPIAPRGHLHELAVALALEHGDPAVVRQQRGPMLDLGGEGIDALGGSAHLDAVP